MPLVPFYSLLFLGAGALAVSIDTASPFQAIGTISPGALAALLGSVSMHKEDDRSVRVAAAVSGLFTGAAAIILVSLPSEEVLGWVLLGASAFALAPAIYIGTLAIGLMSGPSTRVGNLLRGSSGDAPAGVERAIVRVAIPVLLLGSAVGAVVVSLHTSKSEIPSFAFGSHVVLAVQLSLLFFYGALLLVVPLVRAVSGGELPTELSMRGARYAEKKLDESNKEILDTLEKISGEVDESDEHAKEAINQIEAGIKVRDDFFGKQEKINQELLLGIEALKTVVNASKVVS